MKQTSWTPLATSALVATWLISGCVASVPTSTMTTAASMAGTSAATGAATQAATTAGRPRTTAAPKSSGDYDTDLSRAQSYCLAMAKQKIAETQMASTAMNSIMSMMASRVGGVDGRMLSQMGGTMNQMAALEGTQAAQKLELCKQEYMAARGW